MQSKMWEARVGVPSESQSPLGCHIEESGMKDRGSIRLQRGQDCWGLRAEGNNKPRAGEMENSGLTH